MKGIGASLAAQFREGAKTDALRASAASKIDPRTLLGLPSRDEMKGIGASLAAQFREGAKTDALRASAASKIDPRTLLGLPSRDEMKGIGASLAAQFREGARAEALRGASNKTRLDPATLLGIQTSGQSAKASASVFLASEASMMGPSGAELSAMKAKYDALQNMEKQVKKVGQAHDEATGKTKTHAAAMRDAHSAARGLASGMGMMWLTWGNIAPLLAGASLSHGFIQAMKAGTEFAYQLTFVKALGGETAESITQISSAALELSKSGLFGPVELSNGLRTLSQAGLSATESMKALPIALDLATVGEMNMKDAAITLVGVMTAFDLEKSDLSKIGDTFAKAAAVSQTSVEQMTQAMKTASVVGEQYGASMQDTATALTLLAKVNITGTAAGTSLRNMLKELYTPTDKAAKVMKEVGISARTATGDLKPFPDVIFALKKSLEGYNKAGQVKILQDLFGERGAKEAIVMLSQTREEWNKLNRTIGESGGFMRSVAAELEGTVKGSFKQAINTLQATLIEAYNSTEGAAGELAGRLKETFGSAQFKEAVMGIVNGMVALTNALVAMAPALTMAAGGWLALKAAMIGAAAWNAAATALTGATIATQTLGAVALRTATTMTGATGLLAAARMLPGVLAAAGTSLIATTGILGPLAIAIGVAGTAWYLFRDKTLEAMEQSSEAVARGAASMRESLAGVLKEVHNVSAAASRKSLDAAMPALVSGQSELLEMKQKLKNTYKISSDKEAEEFLAKATSTNSTGEVYTQTGAKYDAINAYLKAKTEQKKALQDFARVSKTVESVAEQERMNADKPVVPPKTLKDYNGAGAGSGRADREAAKLENANVLDLEKRYQAELKTTDAYYARLQKIESTSAQYGIKTKEEAESKITALTEEHWAARLEKVSAMSAEMSALLGSSVKLSEADAQKAKTFVATAQEEINTLKEKISWQKEEAALRSKGAEVRFNKDLRGAADELDKEQAARRQKIYGGAEDPITRARNEGMLAAELKYTKLKTEAEEEYRIALLGNDQSAIEGARNRRDVVLETIEEQKAAMASMFEADTRYMQSAEYGWDQFWTKYHENALTAAKMVEGALDSVTKHVEDAFAEMFTTGKFDYKKMVNSILADNARLVAKMAMNDISSMLTGKKAPGGGIIDTFFGAKSIVGAGGMISEEGAYGGKGGGLGEMLTKAGNGLKSFWDSLTGATSATENSTAETVKGVLQTATKTTTETTATSAMVSLTAAAQSAAAALTALSASGGGGGGGSALGALGGLFGGGGSSLGATAAMYGTSVGSEQTAMLAAQMVGMWANGGVPNAAGLHRHANTVVSQPTLFKFASGAGLMGEAGPEAIMPLARDSQGRLGVRYEGRESPKQKSTTNVTTNHVSVSVNSPKGDPAEIRRAGAAVARKVSEIIGGSRRYV
jgi:TP901 family phage tail tape measure protein